MMIVRVSSLFFNKLSVERQLCIVNRGYAIVIEQQLLDQTNKFCSTMGKPCGLDPKIVSLSRQTDAM
jgi:hypothetical protein